MEDEVRSDVCGCGSDKDRESFAGDTAEDDSDRDASPTAVLTSSEADPSVELSREDGKFMAPSFTDASFECPSSAVDSESES